jgi:hypothetical protein
MWARFWNYGKGGTRCLRWEVGDVRASPPQPCGTKAGAHIACFLWTNAITKLWASFAVHGDPVQPCSGVRSMCFIHCKWPYYPLASLSIGPSPTLALEQRFCLPRLTGIYLQSHCDGQWRDPGRTPTSVYSEVFLAIVFSEKLKNIQFHRRCLDLRSCSIRALGPLLLMGKIFLVFAYLETS